MFLLRFLINIFALLLAAYFIPGIGIASLYTAIIVAIALGLINTVIRPILIILTLPITIITLGLFTLVINGLLFWFVASFIEGFEVSSFIAAFFGALFVSIISSLANWAVKKTSD